MTLRISDFFQFRVGTGKRFLRAVLLFLELLRCEPAFLWLVTQRKKKQVTWGRSL